MRLGVAYKNDNSAGLGGHLMFFFFFFSKKPFLVFFPIMPIRALFFEKSVVPGPGFKLVEKSLSQHSCLLYNLKTVQAIFMKLHFNQSTLDDVQSTKTITLAFILFDLFPLESVTKSGRLYNLKTVQAIFRALHIKINKHKATCRAQEP